MLFNSIDFFVFLLIVFIAYWLLKGSKKTILQNILIVITSYIFYGWWDWRFLILIFLSTCVDYFAARGIFKFEKKAYKKLFLSLSLVFNIGMLFLFKYYNFFILEFSNLLTQFGFSPNVKTLSIILPVGISFYTFQTLSYTIDVYKERLVPTDNFINLMAYVSFFPQLVAGPIERATHLLPQFSVERKFDFNIAKNGMRLILFGLFKKVVIADNAAIHVDYIFSNYNDFSFAVLALGAVLFAFQIYGDFSGYSDIAIGVAKLLGFDLMKNFNYPYFSRDIAEFWRRWHISLSTWFRDYLYIPLGGSRGSKFNKVRNVLIIFLVSGFWHGANWTFLVWGGLNALYFLPLLLRNKNRVHLNFEKDLNWINKIKDLGKIVFTFSLTCFAWIFFRSENINNAFSYLKRAFSTVIHGKSYQEIYTYIIQGNKIIFFTLPILLMFEWFQKDKDNPLEIDNFSAYLRWATYLFIFFLIWFLGRFDYQEFIYFQF